MTRNDIHAPASEDFNPEDYDLYAIYDLGWTEEAATDRRNHTADLKALKEAGWRLADIQASRGHGRCGHCGAYIRYAALLMHEDDKTLIYVGETCLEGTFSGSQAQFRTLRSEAAQHAAMVREQGKLVVQFAESLAAAIEFDPALAAFEDINIIDGSAFIYDLRFQMHHRLLSDKQLAAAVKTLTRMAEWEARKAAEADILVPAPAGKTTVSGKALSVKFQENDFGGQWKMLVMDSRNFKVWTTCPAAIVDEAMRLQDAAGKTGDDWDGWSTYVKAGTVTFNATLEPSQDDPCFAFAKRPTKASLTQEA